MNKHVTIGIIAALTLGAGIAVANPARDAIIAGFAAEAGVSGFSARDGEAFFMAKHSGGKPETPSCTSCHTSNPKQSGTTRVGKEILPMAVSVNPDRFTDPETVAKWFRRNCNSVLGRECSPVEKGNILTYLLSL